jgi:hypothetical protein
VSAIETVYADFAIWPAAARQAARRDGFSGRLAIHPAQVPVINEVFTPTPGTRKARDRHRFAAAPGSGVVAIDGKMYGQPRTLWPAGTRRSQRKDLKAARPSRRGVFCRAAAGRHRRARHRVEQLITNLSSETGVIAASRTSDQSVPMRT